MSDQKQQIVKPASFTIDRDTWARGEGSFDSALMRPADSKKCCLGFYALACGATEDQISSVETPEGLDRRSGLELPGMLSDTGQDTPLCHALMETNDQDHGISDEQREANIADGFKGIGVAVVFVGE